MFNDEMEYKAYIKGMDDYIEKLKTMESLNPNEARQKAKESLIRSGILEQDGTPKRQICN